MAGGDTGPLRAALAKSTGARVQLLARAGDEYQATEEELAAAIASADGTSPRIMLLVEGPGSVRVIELD